MSPPPQSQAPADQTGPHIPGIPCYLRSMTHKLKYLHLCFEISSHRSVPVNNPSKTLPSAVSGTPAQGLYLSIPQPHFLFPLRHYSRPLPRHASLVISPPPLARPQK